MTEIPEHLLKRSKERRAAIGGEAAPEAEAEAAPVTGGDVEPAAAAAPAPATAAPVEPPPPEPTTVRPEVLAQQRRRKIPFWAMPVLAALPLWAYVYQGTLEPPPAPADTPFALGEALFGRCASCHGATGTGVGSSPALTGVLETWPDYRDHMMWVRLGSTNWPGDTYGAADQPKAGGMPSFSLTDEELAQVVLYERVQFGGLDPASEEALTLEAIAHGEQTFADVGLGDVAVDAGVDEAEL